MDLSIISGDLTAEQAEKFEKYYNLLVEWNEVMNLTAITEPDEVALRHFADSLTILPYIDRICERIANEGKKGGAVTLVDVGTGAGFPGIPIKIMRPEINITLLDSLKKRLGFLDNVIGQLGLSGVTTVHARAEDAGKNGKYREKYDIAVARAVAPMNILSEYCLPLVRTGGCFIAMKGPAEEEFSRAVKVLGGETEADDVFEIGETQKLVRRIICVNKIAETPPRYPRKAGVPSRQPL
jgi:16S rRNA (guanine527-N7)-methyltransferase